MLDANWSNLFLMELILICARRRRFKFLSLKLLTYSLKELSKEPEGPRFYNGRYFSNNAFIVFDFGIALCITFSTGKAI